MIRCVGSVAVVHVEFDGAWRHFPTGDVFHLQFDIAFNLVLREHVTLQQEVMISGQAIQSFTQRSGYGWHFSKLRWWQVIEILVHGVARVDLVLNAVEASHEQSRIAQIWVRHCVREADFNALGLGTRTIRNTA